MQKPGLSALLLSTVLTYANPLVAGPVEDAQFIIDATVTEEAMYGLLAAMGPMLSGAMESEFRRNGIELSDPEAFTRILMEEFMAGYLDAMRAEMVTVYLEEFTPDELAGIAGFFRTPAGQAMAAKTSTLAERGAAIGGAVGQDAALAVADRLAARLRSEGVTITVDPTMQERLLDLLDQMSDGI